MRSGLTDIYHTSNSRECMGVNGETLQLRTRNNTDGNKLVIFFGIASYYGDNYIFLRGAQAGSNCANTVEPLFLKLGHL